MSATQLIMLGEGAGGGPVTYIEDVFSTYLYTGTGATQTITNGIDLTGKGGLVLLKSRSSAIGNRFYDTARGVTNALTSTLTNAQFVESTSVTAFNSNGFTMGSESAINGSGTTFASWTFRKQPKFFDIVTYTGTGSNTTIPHNLGSVPGCIIVKRTDTTGNWRVYHNGLTSAAYSIQLNLTSAQASATTVWNSTAPTSTVFSVGTDATVNASGGTYVAYLFAHNAGGFGLTGTDNVISCGSYTAATGGQTITLGYEPQWVLIKKYSAAGDNWRLLDIMRGMTVAGSTKYTLAPNTSTAEESWSDAASPSATGFTVNGAGLNDGSDKYIYIAIRRGPMKVPTNGTSVFVPYAYTGNGTSTVINTTNVADLFTAFRRNDSANAFAWATRLIGANAFLTTQSTSAQNTQVNTFTNIGSNTITVGTQGEVNQNSWNYIGYYISRAPTFMDVVCYTGNGATQNLTHNLNATPQLIIVKARSTTGAWLVQPLSDGTKALRLNSTLAQATDNGPWNNTNPTSTTFTVGGDTNTNLSGYNYVAYLFATCAGVSKVGSYTGTAALQTVACGFTTGARFVLIKRTDSTGDWYIWDSARGISSSTDPYFRTNVYDAEVTGTNYVDTDATGFKVTAAASTTVNISSATYIFLAIA